MLGTFWYIEKLHNELILIKRKTELHIRWQLVRQFSGEIHMRNTASWVEHNQHLQKHHNPKVAQKCQDRNVQSDSTTANFSRETPRSVSAYHCQFMGRVLRKAKFVRWSHEWARRLRAGRNGYPLFRQSILSKVTPNHFPLTDLQCGVFNDRPGEVPVHSFANLATKCIRSSFLPRAHCRVHKGNLQHYDHLGWNNVKMLIKNG
jgi:hypothetical protein